MSNEKFISPFTDYGFKRIFGDQNNTILLRSLIDDILGLKDQQRIKTLTFKNMEFLPDHPTDRKAIFDLYCISENGEHFIVKLQKVYQQHFQSRALYYITFPIQGQAERGIWDFELAPIYFIGLLDSEIPQFKDTDRYLHHGKITEVSSKEIMYDDLNMIYLEFPKFKKQEQELASHLEYWLYAINNFHKFDEMPAFFKDDLISMAFEKAQFHNLPKKEQAKYHHDLKIYRDIVNSFNSATQLGFQQGIEQERQKVFQEKSTIAKSLKDLLSDQEISSKLNSALEVVKNL